MAKYKVVVSDDRHADYKIEEEILKSCDAELVVANCVTEDQLIEVCKDADGILLNLAPMTKRVVEKLERCKIVSRYGVGFDNVDVEACTEKGIKVTNVPDYCAEDVSDLALGLLYSALRRIASKDRRIRNGGWNENYNNMFRVQGKTLSLLGFGRISKCLCAKAQSLGFGEIVFYDPFVDEKSGLECNARKVDFDEALKIGDFISLHMPATVENQKIINQKTLSKMKKTAILINTSRGALVDESDLIKALNNGVIGGVALDTFEVEPLPLNSPLIDIDNCVLTDHTGFNTVEAMVELKSKCATNIKEILEGKKSTYPIN